MNRRNFFSMMIGGVAAAAAVRTWPFRVYSFSSEPILALLTVPKNMELIEELVGLELENIRKQIPIMYERESKLLKLMNGNSIHIQCYDSNSRFRSYASII